MENYFWATTEFICKSDESHCSRLLAFHILSSADFRQLSPSQASLDDEASSDSFLCNGDANESLDKNLISHALDTVAKVYRIV